MNMGVIEIIKRQERQEGRQEGVEEKSVEVVTSLILELGFSDEQAARIAKVTLDFVRKVRTDLDI